MSLFETPQLSLPNLDTVRKESEKQAIALGPTQVQELRIRAKTDLFFLATGILGYDKLSINLHGDVCNWIRRTESERFRELLLPRDHLKSTIFTISHSIQIALPDVTGSAPFPQSLGTNVRVLITHETQTMASRFLSSITQHFTSNRLLMAIFPECVPSPRFQRINLTELELPRTKIWSEPTFDTMGVGAKSQGRHYNYIKLDDLIGDKARDSETEMAGAKLWFDNIQSFFVDFAHDKFDIAGTRWMVGDLYEHAHEAYGFKDDDLHPPIIQYKSTEEDRLVKYIRGVLEPDSKGRRQPIFPEGGFTEKNLVTLLKNKKVASAQYFNDPLSSSTEFDESWERLWYWGPGKECLRIFEADDKGKEHRQTIYIRDLDKIIFVDPALKSESGIIVTGTDWREDFRIFALDAIEDVFDAPSLVKELFRLNRVWKPRCVVIEEVIFSKVYEPYLKAEMRLRSEYFRVETQKTNKVQKEARVRGLASYFSAGRIYFNELHKNIRDQFSRFGAIPEFHMLDAMAMGPFHWRSSQTKKSREDSKLIGVEKLKDRSQLTGYSTINYERK